MGCSRNFFRSSVIKMELWSIWKGLVWAWEAGLKLVVYETDYAAAFELVTDRLAKIGSGGSGADKVHLWHQPSKMVCSLLLLRT
ncbi:hypothetical protein AHAS_Ahas09G0280900 [Arachis hypogaea]